MTTHYHLEDYNKIIFDGLYGDLAITVQQIISVLTDEINKTVIQSPIVATNTYQKTNDKYRKPSHSNHSNNFVKRTKVNKSVNDTDWQSLRVPFKTTKIDKKEGIEKSINDIRVSLNKISNKNYETHRDSIIELLKTIIINKEEVDPEDSDEDDEEDGQEEGKKTDDITKVATAIFDIASNNKFFSEIYADLYKDLIGSYSIFNDIIASFIKKYTDSIYEIHYVDPNLEYDKFCEYNKKNDRRKALSAFITNLMKKDIINKSIIIDIIVLFQELVLNYVDEPNKTNEVEEITENIFILVTSSYGSCNTMTEWGNVMENIITCSQLKVKEKQSMSSRAVFKYKDIIDTCKQFKN